MLDFFSGFASKLDLKGVQQALEQRKAERQQKQMMQLQSDIPEFDKWIADKEDEAASWDDKDPAVAQQLRDRAARARTLRMKAFDDPDAFRNGVAALYQEDGKEMRLATVPGTPGTVKDVQQTAAEGGALPQNLGYGQTTFTEGYKPETPERVVTRGQVQQQQDAYGLKKKVDEATALAEAQGAVGLKYQKLGADYQQGLNRETFDYQTGVQVRNQQNDKFLGFALDTAKTLSGADQTKMYDFAQSIRAGDPDFSLIQGVNLKGVDGNFVQMGAEGVMKDLDFIVANLPDSDPQRAVAAQLRDELLAEMPKGPEAARAVLEKITAGKTNVDDGQGGTTPFSLSIARNAADKAAKANAAGAKRAATWSQVGENLLSQGLITEGDDAYNALLRVQSAEADGVAADPADIAAIARASAVGQKWDKLAATGLPNSALTAAQGALATMKADPTASQADISAGEALVKGLQAAIQNNSTDDFWSLYSEGVKVEGQDLPMTLADLTAKATGAATNLDLDKARRLAEAQAQINAKGDLSQTTWSIVANIVNNPTKYDPATVQRAKDLFTTYRDKPLELTMDQLGEVKELAYSVPVLVQLAASPATALSAVAALRYLQNNGIDVDQALADQVEANLTSYIADKRINATSVIAGFVKDGDYQSIGLLGDTLVEQGLMTQGQVDDFITQARGNDTYNTAVRDLQKRDLQQRVDAQSLAAAKNGRDLVEQLVAGGSLEDILNFEQDYPDLYAKFNLTPEMLNRAATRVFNADSASLLRDVMAASEGDPKLAAQKLAALQPRIDRLNGIAAQMGMAPPISTDGIVGYLGGEAQYQEAQRDLQMRSQRATVTLQEAAVASNGIDFLNNLVTGGWSVDQILALKGGSYQSIYHLTDAEITGAATRVYKANVASLVTRAGEAAARGAAGLPELEQVRREAALLGVNAPQVGGQVLDVQPWLDIANDTTGDKVLAQMTELATQGDAGRAVLNSAAFQEKARKAGYGDVLSKLLTLTSTSNTMALTSYAADLAAKGPAGIAALTNPAVRARLEAAGVKVQTWVDLAKTTSHDQVFGTLAELASTPAALSAMLNDKSFQARAKAAGIDLKPWVDESNRIKNDRNYEKSRTVWDTWVKTGNLTWETISKDPNYGMVKASFGLSDAGMKALIGTIKSDVDFSRVVAHAAEARAAAAEGRAISGEARAQEAHELQVWLSKRTDRREEDNAKRNQGYYDMAVEKWELEKKDQIAAAGTAGLTPAERFRFFNSLADDTRSQAAGLRATLNSILKQYGIEDPFGFDPMTITDPAMRQEATDLRDSINRLNTLAGSLTEQAGSSVGINFSYQTGTLGSAGVPNKSMPKPAQAVSGPVGAWAAKNQIDPNGPMTVFAAESSFRPDVVYVGATANGKVTEGALGLFQITVENFRALGYNPDKYLTKGADGNWRFTMPVADQLYMFEQYLRKNGVWESRSTLTPDDLYLTVHFPAARGKSDDFVAYGVQRNSKGDITGYVSNVPNASQAQIKKRWDGNKNLDTDGDGLVTRSEILAYSRSKSMDWFVPSDSPKAAGATTPPPAAGTGSTGATPRPTGSTAQPTQPTGSPNTRRPAGNPAQGIPAGLQSASGKWSYTPTAGRGAFTFPTTDLSPFRGEMKEAWTNAAGKDPRAASLIIVPKLEAYARQWGLPLDGEQARDQTGKPIKKPDGTYKTNREVTLDALSELAQGLIKTPQPAQGGR